MSNRQTKLRAMYALVYKINQPATPTLKPVIGISSTSSVHPNKCQSEKVLLLQPLRVNGIRNQVSSRAHVFIAILKIQEFQGSLKSLF